ncbi:MAG: CerR family C-terminal domain-containing protein [Janthinobacterium lividum]
MNADASPQSLGRSVSASRRGDGNQSRGEEAKLRIVLAAIEIFADQGYEGASTRQLAAHAAVNLASLTYYFDGKPSLYKAALEHVVEKINQVLRPNAERVESLLATESSVTLNKDALYQLLYVVLDQWTDLHLGRTGRPWDKNWTKLMKRAEIDPPVDGAGLYQTTTKLILKPCNDLIGRLLGKDPADEDCVLLTMSILGQVSHFRPQRNGHVAAIGWDEITTDRHQRLTELFHRNVYAILDAAAKDKSKSRRRSPNK